MEQRETGTGNGRSLWRALLNETERAWWAALIQTRMGLEESEVLPETVLLVEARKGLLRHQLSLFFTVLHSVGAYITKLGVSHLILHL